MSTTAHPVSEHPIIGFATRLSVRLDALADVPAWSMSRAEQAAALVELERQQARLRELWLRVLVAGDHADVAGATAGTSTAAWLAHETVRPVGAAQADVALATALEDGFEATRQSLAAGDVDVERASVVVRAVQGLPSTVVEHEPDLPRRAEKHLLELARTHDARQLRRLGRHVLHVLDPDAADERLGAQLEREEQDAARATYLELHDNGDGTAAGRFKVSALHGAILRRALESLTSPAVRSTGEATPTEPTRTRPELLGQAFGELIERIDPTRLPQHGGVTATVVVTLDYERLVTGLGTARLDTGERISAGEARRLACQADVIPAVVRRLVDGSSVVLDLGRKRRLHTEHMRIALGMQHAGCAAEGCTRPSGWRHAHHPVPWSRGGGTSVANGQLLCPFHHHRAHSSGYDTQQLPSGGVRFTRRT